MSRRYDCIVLGVGGFGSAALYHAAARGLSVLGLEQFSVAHDRGSSHGETRIIRKAYFEHPDYVPLLLSAYDLWRKLEAEAGRTLMHLCGLLLAGPPEGESIAGARLASRIHGVPLQSVAAAEAERRFSGFRCPETFAIAYEPEAGYLEVERCVRAHVDAAIQRGATLSTDEVVEGWQPVGNMVRVRTSKGAYETAALIVTAGAWTSRILNELALPLEVVRKPVFWFPVRSSAYAVDAGAPTFYFEMPFGHFYGFASIDRKTVKAAEHSGGEPVADPHQVERAVCQADWEPLARFVGECLPQLDPTPVRHSVCMYTLTPDRHFIVDRHSEHAQVAFGAGFSGHGFKFTPVIGEAIVDLATEGHTRQPIGFLSAGREALAK
jgi:sarcosine oxidase